MFLFQRLLCLLLTLFSLLLVVVLHLVVSGQVFVLQLLLDTSIINIRGFGLFLFHLNGRLLYGLLLELVLVLLLSFLVDDIGLHVLGIEHGNILIVLVDRILLLLWRYLRFGL